MSNLSSGNVKVNQVLIVNLSNYRFNVLNQGIMDVSFSLWQNSSKRSLALAAFSKHILNNEIDILLLVYTHIV